jgi:hypothetical protein
MSQSRITSPIVLVSQAVNMRIVHIAYCQWVELSDELSCYSHGLLVPTSQMLRVNLC